MHRLFLTLLLVVSATTMPLDTSAQISPETDSLMVEIAVQRAQGDYVTALATCKYYLGVLAADSRARPFHIEDAKRQVQSVSFILSLPDSAQTQMAWADEATLKVVELYNEEKYSEAVDLQRQGLAIQLKWLGRENAEVATSMDNLAVVLEEAGSDDADEMEALYRDTLSLRRKILGTYNRGTSTSLSNLAMFLEEWRSDLASAQVLYEEALAIDRRELAADDADLATDLNNLGTLLEELGNTRGAEQLLTEALAIRRKTLGPRDSETLGCASNLGSLCARMSQYDRAGELLNDALAGTVENEDAAGLRPKILANIGELYLLRGLYSNAATSFRAALKERVALVGETHRDVAISHYNLANALTRLGEAEHAEKELEAALTIDRRYLGDAHRFVVRDLVHLGALQLEQGDLRGATARLEEAARSFENSRQLMGLSDLSRAYGGSEYSPYSWLAQAQLQSNRGHEAWASVESDRGRLMMDMVGGISRPLTTGELKTGSELRARVQALTAALGVMPDEGPERKEALESLAAAHAEFSRFEGAMHDKYPKAPGGAPSLAGVQSRLEDGDAIVGWLENEKFRMGYVVRKSGPVHWVQLPAAPVTAVQNFLSRVEDPRSSATAVRESGTAIYAASLQPLEVRIADASRLIVVPSGSMLGIPVASLTDGQGRWLGERWQVAYTPSSSVLAWVRSLSGPKSSVSLLAVGNPPFRPTSDNDAEGSAEVASAPSRQDWEDQKRGVCARDRAALAMLAPLPWTEREIADVAAHFDRRTVLVGSAASERGIVELVTSDRLRGYRYLHFATHAFADDEIPGQSTLVLSQIGLPNPVDCVVNRERLYDGCITMDEVLAEWKLDADLVTLSGCETGLGPRLRGEGYVGFSHALLQAGARTVLVSLWSVGDEATRELMARFYRYLIKDKVSKVEALARAQSDLRDHSRAFAHPYYWSGFVLVGDAR